MASLKKLQNPDAHMQALTDIELENISGGSVAGDIVEYGCGAVGACIGIFIWPETGAKALGYPERKILYTDHLKYATDKTGELGCAAGGFYIGRKFGQSLRQKWGI